MKEQIITDLEKPVKMTITVETGRLFQAFLLKTLEVENMDTNKLFNNWIRHFVGIKQPMTINEKYADYLASRSDDIITMTDLRELGLVSQNKFRKHFETNREEINYILKTKHHLSLCDYKHTKGNVKALQLVKWG